MSGAEPASGWTVWRRNVIEAVPRFTARRDGSVPAIVAASLFVHAVVVGGLYLSQADDTAARPHEIPVEIVQLPPEPPKPPAPKPTPPAAKPPEKAAQQQPKPTPKPPQKVAQKEPPKPAPKPAPKPVAKAAPQPQPPARSVAERMKDLLGPMPGLAAVALPGSAEAGEVSVSYSQLVMSKIAKAKKEGRYPGVPGYATVSFSIGDDGHVTTLDLRRPSGDPSLDTEAVALVKRAEPYPPPPPGGRRDYVVTLQFRPVP